MLTITQLISWVFTIAFVNTTIVLCLYKWKILENYQVFRKKWMPKADCYLCITFWLGLAFTMPFVMDLKWQVGIIPFAGASISNYLINISIIHEINKNRK